MKFVVVLALFLAFTLLLWFHFMARSERAPQDEVVTPIDVRCEPAIRPYP